MGSESWRPAATSRNRSPREAREAARQALRPGCEELALRIRVMPETEARSRVKNRHSGAPRGERPALWDARRLARRLAYRVISAFTRVFDAHDTPHECSAEHPHVSRRSAHVSIRGEWSKVAKPGRNNASRERDGLFEIVRWELPKTVRRRATGSAVLMLRDASQRTWAVKAPA